jgi:hypothetical protein
MAPSSAAAYDDTQIPINAATAWASSSYPGYPPSAAFDGNASTPWIASGMPEQWIAVDLGATRIVSRVQLVLQAASSPTTIVIATNPGDWNWVVQGTVSGTFGANQTLDVPLTWSWARYLWVRMTQNAGWPGFLEIRAYGPNHQATFVSQSVPTAMTGGQTYPASVTMRNDGADTWTAASLYRLGSQYGQDNLTWGTNRVFLPASVPPGGQVTFNFNVTAPYANGTYNFQWRMVHDGVTWFGASSPLVQVAVAGAVTLGSWDALSATTVAPGGDITVWGWGADSWSGTTAVITHIYVDGLYKGQWGMGGYRPDVAGAFGRPDFTYSGFAATFSTAGMAAGWHTVTVYIGGPYGGWIASTQAAVGHTGFTITNSCGNGVVDSGEVCDRGSLNGAAGSCCAANCTAVANETVCDYGTPAVKGAGRCQNAQCVPVTVANNESTYVGSNPNGQANGTACTDKSQCRGGACSLQADNTYKCASAANNVLYFHGRLMASWPPNALLSYRDGWRHWVFSYDGNQRLQHQDIAPMLGHAMKQACTGGNTCLAVCYSAGCLRMLQAISDAGGPTTLTGFLGGIASASAAGGSELARPELRNEMSKWSRLMTIVSVVLSVLSGYPTLNQFLTAGTFSLQMNTWTYINMVWTGGTMQLSYTSGSVPGAEQIDKDLTPEAARQTHGGLQGLAPAPIYHLAGHEDICTTVHFLVFRYHICGNGMMNKHGDGVVPIHSSCGYNTDQDRHSCCDTGPEAKYYNRFTAPQVRNISGDQPNGCSYQSTHTQMLMHVNQAGNNWLASPVSARFVANMWSTSTAPRACNPLIEDECYLPPEPGQPVFGTVIAGAYDATYASLLQANPQGFCHECDANGISACRLRSVGCKTQACTCNSNSDCIYPSQCLGTPVAHCVGYDPGPSVANYAIATSQMDNLFRCDQCLTATGQMGKCCDMYQTYDTKTGPALGSLIGSCGAQATDCQLVKGPDGSSGWRRWTTNYTYDKYGVSLGVGWEGWAPCCSACPGNAPNCVAIDQEDRLPASFSGDNNPTPDPERFDCTVPGQRQANKTLYQSVWCTNPGQSLAYYKNCATKADGYEWCDVCCHRNVTCTTPGAREASKQYEHLWCTLNDQRLASVTNCATKADGYQWCDVCCYNY